MTTKRVAEGKIDAVRLLLDWKANPNAKAADGATALLEAVRFGHQAVAQLLLGRGACVDVADADGNTPLMIAAEGTAYFPNNAPMTEAVLKAKPQINAQDSRGRTALYRASTEGKLESMRLLIEHHANPDLQALDGSTALLETVTFGHLSAASLLLDHRANVDLADANGNTPLMVAAEGNVYTKPAGDFITLLLRHGAKTSLADNRNRTALARATESRNIAAIELLKQK